LGRRMGFLAVDTQQPQKISQLAAGGAKEAEAWHLGHPWAAEDPLPGHQVDIPALLPPLQDDQAARGICG